MTKTMEVRADTVRVGNMLAYEWGGKVYTPSVRRISAVGRAWLLFDLDGGKAVRKGSENVLVVAPDHDY